MMTSPVVKHSSSSGATGLWVWPPSVMLTNPQRGFPVCKDIPPTEARIWGCGVGVSVGVRVVVGVRVSVGVGVGVDVGNEVGVGVKVAVGVPVNVGVAVEVLVGAGVDKKPHPLNNSELNKKRPVARNIFVIS